MAAIVKVLNIHMSSLKWIDDQTVALDRKMQQLSHLQQKVSQI
jgi:hypothetical protein